jgi:hypothetical protein
MNTEGASGDGLEEWGVNKILQIPQWTVTITSNYNFKVGVKLLKLWSTSSPAVVCLTHNQWCDAMQAFCALPITSVDQYCTHMLCYLHGARKTFIWLKTEQLCQASELSE